MVWLSFKGILQMGLFHLKFNYCMDSFKQVKLLFAVKVVVAIVEAKVIPCPIFSLVLAVDSVGFLFWSKRAERQSPFPLASVEKTSTVDVDTQNCRPTRVLSSQ